jgi:ribosomal protein L40E
MNSMLENWSNLMLAENSDILHYILIVLIFALLIVRMTRKEGGQRKGFAILAFKKCPQCTAQLPLSALVCDDCDYNFLSSSILRHKLLPASGESMVGAAPQQSFAYRAGM